jgi:hypothetical protein
MKLILALAAALAAVACASFDGRGLVPGRSSAAEVDALMGPAAETRRQSSGETWLYYPRQPAGRKMFVARIGPDDRLIALEQRLTDENVAKLEADRTRGEEVRELLGPPYLVTGFPRMSRDVWEYHFHHFGDPGIPMALYVQFSPDGVVREIYRIDESTTRGRGGRG